MNKGLTKAICIFGLILAPTVGQGTAVTATSSGSTGVDGAVTGVQGVQPSVKDGAGKSQSGNSFAQALNYVVGGSEVAMGGQMISAGTGPCHSHGNCSEMISGIMMVGMGLQNIAQGNEHGSAAGSAGITGFQSDGFGGLTNPGSSTDPYVKAAQSDANFKAVASNLKTLAASGVYNPKLGTFKVGDKTYNQSDFASVDAMKAAGLSSSLIDSALAANAAAEKKGLAKLDKVKVGATAENGYAEGGGGGGFGSPTSGNAEIGANEARRNAGLNRTNLDRDPSSLAGMSKNFNGEPIGVAADSIFLMMSRRYKVKESQESFFTPADLALQK